MKERPTIDLGLTGYDELFITDAERKEARLPRIYDIPIADIDTFQDTLIRCARMRIWLR